jgi:hypothetical protein
MSADQTLLQVEGTWEEILARSAEFVGRRVRITVLADQAPPTLAVLAHRWADECERLPAQPSAEPTKGIKGEFIRLLNAKLRRQGLLS